VRVRVQREVNCKVEGEGWGDLDWEGSSSNENVQEDIFRYMSALFIKFSSITHTYINIYARSTRLHAIHPVLRCKLVYRGLSTVIAYTFGAENKLSSCQVVQPVNVVALRLHHKKVHYL